jgi:hypothetical protein
VLGGGRGKERAVDRTNQKKNDAGKKMRLSELLNEKKKQPKKENSIG